MSVAVTVLDYGIGNLLNMVRALQHCGAAVQVVAHASEAPASSGHLVLPGVGAFGDGMQEMRARGFDDLVLRHAESGRPFLGVCVGMQMMFDASEEMGEHTGLGLLAGRVQPIAAVGLGGLPHPIPHIGWRRLHPLQPLAGSVLVGMPDDTRVYFVHSFAAQPTLACDTIAQALYDGVPVCAAVRRGNLHGCQFHPERSGSLGLGFLQRFLQL